MLSMRVSFFFGKEHACEFAKEEKKKLKRQAREVVYYVRMWIKLFFFLSREKKWNRKKKNVIN